tara:strand:- start:459 stop:908 length:450 start_codon:yes stop_codon:yes gene_type:complete
MINKISKLFKKDTSDDEILDLESLTKLSSVALFIELCKSDNNVDQVEIDKIIKIAKTKFKISENEADLLFEQAVKKNKDSTSLYEFTNIINQAFQKKDKYLLIRNIWEVAFADNRIDPHEEYLIRKISDLIYVSHADFIKAKFEAKKLS